MESVKIGSVGLGRLGYEHAKNLAASIPGCVLHAICNVDTSRLRAVAEYLGVPHTCTDFAAMCADPELDGIVIVSPSFLHVEQIKIAMEHGKHIFCEKPLGTNVAQCKEAEKVVEAHPELVFQLGFMRRFDPSYAEAKRRVDAGEIGKVVLVRSCTQDPRSTIESTLKFLPHSGGQFLDMCVHDLDLIRWFTGSNIRNVWAIGGVFEFDLCRELHDTDNAAAMVQCENGAMAFLFANHFNIVGLGKDFSKNLGVPYNLVLFSGLTIAAMITASIVVVVGSISYIGLIVPNVVAMYKGDKIRGTLVDTALFGAIFVLVCDMIGRVVIAPYELPIELIVGILGSLIFIALLFYRLKHGRKAIRLGGAGTGCCSTMPNLKGGADQ